MFVVLTLPCSCLLTMPHCTLKLSRRKLCTSLHAILSRQISTVDRRVSDHHKYSVLPASAILLNLMRHVSVLSVELLFLVLNHMLILEKIFFVISSSKRILITSYLGRDSASILPVFSKVLLLVINVVR